MKGSPFAVGSIIVDGVPQKFNHTWPESGQRNYAYSGVGFTVEREDDVGQYKIFRVAVVDAPRGTS
ncbi:MAG: hypothetical protein ACOYD0_08375 [Candidatus Nanopelagicales bacterium]